MHGITGFLGMFEKVDDIVYEPLKLFCDALRQPLKQLDIHNEKSKENNEANLKMKVDKFEADLEFEKKEREMQLSAEQRKIAAEIDEMIANNNLKQREAMIQHDVKYRKEMADAAAQLGQIMANMSVETRSQIIELYKEKEQEYLDLQFEYKKQMYDNVKNIRELFPDGSGEDIIRNEVTSQLNIINERSTEFSKILRTDMVNVLNNIDHRMSEIIGLATKYFQPVDKEQPALTQKIVDAIEMTEEEN